jgi:thiamine pyrophosphate-dependent acetolactate synthase large subunit-like protein
MNGSALLRRRPVIARLLRDRGDLLVVTGLGSPTYDVAAAGDHPRNFHLWGAMGGAAMTGLGLALARPDDPVAVVTGDGEMLMGLGGFATIAMQAPPNLRIVVLDNGLYGETGGQKTHTAGPTDLAAVAIACGLRGVTIVNDAGVDALAARLVDARGGAEVAVIKIDPENAPRLLPSRDGVMLKIRMRRALGLDDGL